jgi:hypothetical protein
LGLAVVRFAAHCLLELLFERIPGGRFKASEAIQLGPGNLDDSDGQFLVVHVAVLFLQVD